MKTFIAKPHVANTLDSMEFNTAVEAIQYLNSKLAAPEGDEDYSFVAPKLPDLSKLQDPDPLVAKRANKKLQEAIEDYQNIGKLVVVE
jgi:hypothetical protein